MAGHTGQHGEQTIFDGQAEASADSTTDGGDFGAGLGATHMQPVFAAQRDGAHGVFGEVVGQVDVSVIEAAAQFGPLIQGAGHGLAERAFGQCGVAQLHAFVVDFLRRIL